LLNQFITVFWLKYGFSLLATFLLDQLKIYFSHAADVDSPAKTMDCQFVYRFELTIVAQTELDATSLTKIKDLNNIKIMVVDDEPSLTSLLIDFLSSYGVYVVMFNSPKQAFEAFILQVEDIDLVITVQNMLRMSGMLSAEKMLRLKPALPIILRTGFNEHATAESTAKMGIARFFDKLLKMAKLLLKVKALVKLHSLSKGTSS